MRNNEFIPKIPYGTRDFLPKETFRKRLLETEMAAMFSRWGYEEIITPTMEYLDVLEQGGDPELVAHLFKLFDMNNRTLALRPDMTTPIARVAATRLKEQQSPLRLFYLTNVFRYEQAQAGRQCEFYQGGVELLGQASPMADAEVITLAVETIRRAGVGSFQISVGQVQFIQGMMEEAGLGPELQHAIKEVLVKRNLVGLGELLQEADIPASLQRALSKIPLLHGGVEVLQQARALTNSPLSQQAIDNLESIYRSLCDYGVQDAVVFDLGMIRDFEYYTGMVFEAYTPGLGFPLCGGGRYDNMVQQFGTSCPATGFAVGIERLLLALERQQIDLAAQPKDVFVAWTAGKSGEAIRLAQGLRQQGKVVELAGEPLTMAVAEQLRQERGFAVLQFCGE